MLLNQVCLWVEDCFLHLDEHVETWVVVLLNVFIRKYFEIFGFFFSL